MSSRFSAAAKCARICFATAKSVCRRRPFVAAVIIVFTPWIAAHGFICPWVAEEIENA